MSTTASADRRHDYLTEIDRRFAFHPFTALGDHERAGAPVMMVRGEGVYLEDTLGRRYIDSMAGLWCVNVGYGRAEIARALEEQARTLPYCHAFSSMASDKPALLAEKLIAMAPVPMSKVFFGNSGSDANDTQAKIVWYYNNARGLPAKKKIIARKRGYHGVTVMSGSMTGLPGLHAGFDLPLPYVKHTTAPHRLWEGYGLGDAQFTAKLADDLERLILAEGPDTVGAFILEPVMGAGGVIVPPQGYYEAVHAIAAKYDLLLIADEVICGFGRLGTTFGSLAVGLKPDLITIAKGLTSAYFPLSGCMVSEKVWRVLADEGGAKFGAFGHGYTYSSHPLGAAAALANLEIVERDGLVQAAADRGRHLHRRLREAFGEHPLVGEIRGFGLIGAVEFVARRDPPLAFDPAVKVGPRIAKAALSRGLVTRALPSADTIAFSPPFVITDAQIDTAIAAAREAVDQVMHELQREGAWRP